MVGIDAPAPSVEMRSRGGGSAFKLKCRIT